MSDASTVNRLILRGAAHHDREAVFLAEVDGTWTGIPDWRADRHSIRIALALRELHGIGPGDTVAIAMPLCLESVLVERAVWGLGATSVRASEASVRLDRELAGELLERGAVLDTAERASQFRSLSRETPPEAVASIENGEERTHGAWMRAIERFYERFPPTRGRTHEIGSDTPDIESRVAIFAGWGDGLTRTAMGRASGSTTGSFVRL